MNSLNNFTSMFKPAVQVFGQPLKRTKFSQLALSLFLALGVLFFQIPINAQNFIYEASYESLKVINNQIGICYNPLTFQGTAKMSIFDNTGDENNPASVTSKCYNNLNGGEFISDPFSRTVSDPDLDPTQITFSFTFFEDDNGASCEFNSGDECLFSRSEYIYATDPDVRIGQKQRERLRSKHNIGDFRDGWAVDLVYTWNYVEVLVPDIRQRDITTVSEGCCTKILGLNSTQSNVSWYWQNSVNELNSSSSRNSRFGLFTVCPDFSGQESKIVYLRARGDRNDKWSAPLAVTIFFPVIPVEVSLSTSPVNCYEDFSQLTANTIPFNPFPCTYVWEISLDGGTTFEILEKTSSNVYDAPRLTKTAWYRVSIECEGSYCSSAQSDIVKVEFYSGNTLKTQNITVQLDENGTVTIDPNDIITSTSNFPCGISSIQVSPNTFGCENIGINDVVITIVDNYGFPISKLVTVTVENNLPLVAKCKDATIQLFKGFAFLSPGLINDGTSDNCGTALTSVFPVSFTCANVGENTVTLSATDLNGNSSSCTATVTVQDVTPPKAKCRDITIQLDATGKATIGVSDVNNGSSDDCSIQSRSIDNDAFTCADVGAARTTTLTVVDVAGNVSACLANVTVQDITPPIALCHEVTVQLDETGNASIDVADIDNGSNDACGIQSLSIDNDAFTCADIGAGTTTTLTVVDVNGNVATCTSNITVEDNTPPVALCKAVIVQLDANGVGSVTAAEFDDGSSDACGPLSFAFSTGTDQLNFDCNAHGIETIIEVVVTDGSGNSSTCETSVTAVDNIAPVANCKDVTITLDENGQGSYSADIINDGSTDNCGLQQFGAVKFVSCEDIGTSQATFTAVDLAGNKNSCTGNITIGDYTVPVTQCKAVTVQLNANGEGSVTAAEFDNGSTDACGPLSFAFSTGTDQLNFDCNAHGIETIIEVVVTDGSGNSSTCETSVTAVDNIAPVALCKDVTITLDENGQASYPTEIINDGSSDNCGLQQFPAVRFVSCEDIGTSQATFTAVDLAGNKNSCTGNITIVDNTAPVALCKAITVQLDETGNASIDAADVDNASTDACGIQSLSLDNNTFTCANVGIPNTTTLTVVDANGNVSTCTSNVTVEDNTPPLANCRNARVRLNQNGTGRIRAQNLGVRSTDACGPLSFTFDNGTIRREFDCGDISQQFDLVVLVTDANGNQSSCISTVTVLDIIPPVAHCKAVTVQLDNNGVGSISAEDINDGSSDNCGGLSFAFADGSDQLNFDCNGLTDMPQVVLVVSDPSGNSSTCEASVTVVDNIAPVANCKDVTITLDENGQASYPAEIINDGSSDNCGLQQFPALKFVSCEDIGTSQAIFTAVDLAGNKNSCTGNITIVDNSAPVALCKAVTAQLDNNGVGSISAEDMDDGSSDNCGPLSFAFADGSDHLNFDCNGLTDMPQVVLVVSNPSGNSSTCEASVTVQDNIAPVANCKDVTITLDENGQGSYPAEIINDGSSDNCGLQQFPALKFVSCEDIGTFQATFTAVDLAGNKNSCTGNITIVDNSAPVALCKAITVQLDDNGEGSITAEDIDDGSTDACGISSIALDVSSFDCSNIGENAVILTVTDNNGNSSSCTALVDVEDNQALDINCPSDIVVDSDPSLCGAVVDFDITATDNCLASINQDFGLSSGSIFPIGVTDQQFTATDAAGNQESCFFTVEVIDAVDPESLSSYTVIGFNGITMQDNNVQSGGVGVTNSGGLVLLEKGTSVNSFVKSPQLELKDGSQVGEYFSGKVSTSILPGFRSGSSCGNDVKVSDNKSKTLDKACYGKIEVEKNARVTFSGHSTVNIQEFILKEGSEIYFNQSTDLLIKKGFTGEKGLVISNSGYEVWIYAKEDVVIKENSQVSGNIYTKKKLEAEKGSSFTGLFIANKVDSKEGVTWNGGNGSCSSSIGNSLITIGSETGKVDQHLQEWKETINLSAFPNPFHEVVNLAFSLTQEENTSIEIFNLQGQRVQVLLSEMLSAGQHRIQWDGSDQNGRELSSGVYLIRLRSGKALINQRVVLQR